MSNYFDALNTVLKSRKRILLKRRSYYLVALHKLTDYKFFKLWRSC